MVLQVEWLRLRYPELDIEVDGGLSPKTIDHAAKVRLLTAISSPVASLLSIPHKISPLPLPLPKQNHKTTTPPRRGPT